MWEKKDGNFSKDYKAMWSQILIVPRNKRKSGPDWDLAKIFCPSPNFYSLIILSGKGVIYTHRCSRLSLGSVLRLTPGIFREYRGFWVSNPL